VFCLSYLARKRINIRGEIISRMSTAEPFVLYTSKRFFDSASKAFDLGRTFSYVTKKPLCSILRKMNVEGRELDRDSAKEALERLGQAKGITVTMGQLVKAVSSALLTPVPLMLAKRTRITYISGLETDDGVFLEFLASIQSMFGTQFYFVWLIVPKTPEGGERIRKLFKSMVEKVGAPPLTEKEWENLRPIIEKLEADLKIRGVTENLWTTL